MTVDDDDARSPRYGRRSPAPARCRRTRGDRRPRSRNSAWTRSRPPRSSPIVEIRLGVEFPVDVLRTADRGETVGEVLDRLRDGLAVRA